MCLTEFNEKEYIDLVRVEGREEGQDLLASLINILLSTNRFDEIRRVSTEPVYRKQLLKEYALI